MPIQTTKPYTDPKLARLRRRFAVLMENGKYAVGLDKWMEEVKKFIKSDEPTPEEWVAAAEQATTKCDRCTNGTYYWGACVNGKMTHAAPCFRCGGKGRQTHEDHKRNRYYDNHNMKIV